MMDILVLAPRMVLAQTKGAHALLSRTALALPKDVLAPVKSVLVPARSVLVPLFMIAPALAKGVLTPLAGMELALAKSALVPVLMREDLRKTIPKRATVMGTLLIKPKIALVLS